MMNKLLKLPFSFKETCSNMKKFYLKIQSANKHRFQSRIVTNKAIHYPPSIDGTEDYEVTCAKQIKKIKDILGVRPHPERPVFEGEYSLDGPPKGRVYEKFPFKFTVEKGKVYQFCTCGYSNNQPFCDSTHKMLWTTYLKKKPGTIKYRPIKYIADETKDVWFCNCKQSSRRPLCDGTHKTDAVQKEESVK